MFTRNRRAKLLLAGVAMAAAGVLAPLSASAATTAHTTAAAASPATVAVRSGWFGLDSQGYGYCLDSNAKGQVYLNKCQVPGNHYQDWIWTEWKAYSPYSGYYYFYSIKDKATGRCLDSNAVVKGAWGHVYTSPCQAPGNPYQDWHWSAASWKGFTKFTDVATSLSLWGAAGYQVVTSTQAVYLNWKLIQ